MTDDTKIRGPAEARSPILEQKKKRKPPPSCFQPVLFISV